MTGATGSPTGEPMWLQLEPEPVYAVLHTPPRAAETGKAVLLLPAFGWDDDCSYRRRRDWAVALADAGMHAARIDFPGCEDSVGTPRDPGRVDRWLAATEAAATWLRERSGCERLTAVGIGLGGFIAYEAAASREAPIDDLLIWGARASGRAYVRELLAYAAATGGGAERSEEGSGDGSVGIGGHVMSAETVTALGAIDLTRRSLPSAAQRRVLLIGRDAHGVDRKLREHLIASGVEVTVLESDEYRPLMSPPDLELAPAKAVSASIDWLRAAPRSSRIAHPQRTAVPEEALSVTFECDGVTIRERVTVLESSAGRLTGIISEPASPSGADMAPACLVSVNSGALRRTGPNRMFVEIARRAAANGVPAARFDLPGLGDSDGVAIKSFERTAADEPASLAILEEIYDHLSDIGVAERFVAGGFSLGGYLAVRVALAEPRSAGAISVNPTGFNWTVKQRQRVVRDFIAMAGPEALGPEREQRAWPGPLQPLVEGLRRRRRRLEAEARRRLAHSDALWRLEHRREIRGLRRDMAQLQRLGTPILLLLSDDEQLLRMLDQPRLTGDLERCPNLSVERLPDSDHLLRPLWIQEIVADLFISALIDFCSVDGRPDPKPTWTRRVINQER